MGQGHLLKFENQSLLHPLFISPHYLDSFNPGVLLHPFHPCPKCLHVSGASTVMIHPTLPTFLLDLCVQPTPPPPSPDSQNTHNRMVGMSGQEL